MENKLAENIRNCRKNLGLTQEQLAERLGITLGAVSKWERGSSEPDLGFIMDLAELFHVSVDALIGFSMRGIDADGEADRLEELSQTVSLEELAEECERAMRRFPNHFRIVLCAAGVHNRIGSMLKKKEHLKRSLELYRHAVELVSQNTDPEINEVILRNQIAGCYSEMEDYRKAVEEYKRNNHSGSNNAMIGAIMVCREKNFEEGIRYIDNAFLTAISDISNMMTSYTEYYLRSNNPAKALRATEWDIGYMRSLKEDPDKRCYLDKIICLFILGRAIVLDRMGETAQSEKDLQEAVEIARAFDADPVYTLENVLFSERRDIKASFYDNAGPTAVESLKGTLEDFADHVSDALRGKFEQVLRS